MAITTPVSLVGLRDDQIESFLRYMLMTNVTSPNDAWLDGICGPVVETPNEDRLRRGWLGGISDYGRVSGGLVEETLTGDENSRVYEPFGGALRVYGRERRMGLVAQVQQRIMDRTAAATRMWANEVCDIIVTSAVGSAPGPRYKALVDDEYLFSDISGARTADNKITATIAGAAPTVAETETTLWSTVEALMGFVDDKTRTINEGYGSFTVFCSHSLGRQMSYALGAPVIIDGSVARTNLMAVSASGKNFQLVASQKFSSWGATQFAMFINNGRGFIRARDPRSVLVTDAEYMGVQSDAYRWQYREDRGVFANDWQSCIHVTMSA